MVEYWRRTDGDSWPGEGRGNADARSGTQVIPSGRKSTSFDPGKKRDPNPCRYSSSNAVTKHGPETVAKTFTQTQPQEKGLTQTERYPREKEITR